MPWVAISEIAKALGISPEKAGWLMRRLGLRRRRVKGRSQWFIEPELLPGELKPKLLPLLGSDNLANTATRKLLSDGLQNTATSKLKSRSNSATYRAKKTAISKAENPPKELLRIVYDYLKHNHPVIEKERLRGVLQASLRKLLDELMPKDYKPIEVERALVQVIKSYRDLGFMDLLAIGDEP
ncbi:MAG: hypothetical protein DRN15_11330 [Thermoprotei archaeon]|nr:MAG: hypothetical protein DRN15_11330 [Thermoprotei archaeon]